MMKLKLLSHTPEPENMVSKMAMGFDDGKGYIVRNLIERGREGMLKYATFTFAVEGISQNSVNRLTNYEHTQELRQSYPKNNEFEFIMPEMVENNKKVKDMYVRQMELLNKTYKKTVNELILDKIFKGDYYYDWYQLVTKEKTNEDTKDWDITEIYDDIKNKNEECVELFAKHFKKEYNKYKDEAIDEAAYLLPLSAKVNIVFTMDAYSLRQFFNCYISEVNCEMGQLSQAMLSKVYKVSPSMFEDIKNKEW